MRCKPHARFGRRPGETEQTATPSPRPGPTSPGRPRVDECRRRVQQDTLRPPRPQGRPAVQDPRAAAPRPRAPHRPAGAKLNTCLSPATPAGKSPSPGTATSSSARCTRPTHPPRAGGSPSRSSPPSPPARSPKSPASAGRCSMWRPHVLAWFDTHRISNGGTEAVNLPHREDPTPRPRLPHLHHYRLRILLAASGKQDSELEDLLAGDHPLPRRDRGGQTVQQGGLDFSLIETAVLRLCQATRSSHPGSKQAPGASSTSWG